ncbi:MAG: transcriptional regulator [Verrucomicrobiota bacterium]|jgi:DNA-binding transcriptional ArsR family regulator|nr:transcriptional regulator [Verrucomicrobiota bacterium]
MSTYQPTVWRTCRALANKQRLQCLEKVLKTPGTNVAEIARLCRIRPNQASMSLRTLQARGLILSVRESRWVRYYPQADPIVPSAGPILAGMSRALLTDRMAHADVLRCLTAFTHPRRLTILSLLRPRSPVPFAELSRKSQVSPMALSRHLLKLQKRGLIATDGEGNWTLLPPPTPLAVVFLNVLATARGV